MPLTPSSAGIMIDCIFQLGTPLAEYAIISNVRTGRTAILEISEEVFDFLVSAKIPICEPDTIPPGSLANQLLVCVFQFNLGTEEPALYVVTRDADTGEPAIFQIPPEAFEFFSAIGIPECPIVSA